MSNKADRKELAMEPKKERSSGRFLNRRSWASGALGRWVTITVLLAWDGLLLYMIVRCLIEPVYGAAFVAVVSIYLGNLL